ncbi:hypothetical protein SeMB42_g01407, partial [Synchytrium endobioticum]
NSSSTNRQLEGLRRRPLVKAQGVLGSSSTTGHSVWTPYQTNMSTNQAPAGGADDETAPLLRGDANLGGTSSSRPKFERLFSKVFWILLAISLGVLAIFAVWLIAPRDHDGDRDNDNRHEPCLTADCVISAARILKAMDDSVDPCDDFFSFSCNGWTRSYPIPPSKSRIGTFDNLQDENQLILKTVLESPYPLDDELQPDEQVIDKYIFANISSLYQSCMNESVIDSRGAEPIEALLERATAFFPLADRKGKLSLLNLTASLAAFHDIGLSPFFGIIVGPDAKQPEVNVINMVQSGLGLPSKDYYKDDKVMAVYQDAMAELFKLLSLRKLVDWTMDNFAAGVVSLEKEIAKISWDPEQLQQPALTYNPYQVGQISTLLPKVDWLHYFQSRFPEARYPNVIANNTILIVEPPSYYINLTKVIEATKPVVLQNYMIWHLVKRYSTYLASDLRSPVKKINAQLSGTNVDPPRYETCLKIVDGVSGMAAGKYFVKKAFGGDSKQAVERGIDNVKQSMINRLQELQWVDDETRQEGIEKVKSLRRKIGYPEYIMKPSALAAKYSGLWRFVTDRYFENIVQSDQWDVQDNLAKILKPVDFDEFDMTPSTVNAYYNPPLNEIVFPAGILGGSFYSRNQPIYLNYGGIGSVISHELTHAFDNNGREFDSRGRLRDWWTNATAVEFEKLSTCFINQYDNYTIIDPDGNPQHLNGHLTLGENLADNGIMRSYEAYQMDVQTDKSANDQSMPGLQQYSKDQLFYLAFAQVWCGSVRPEQALARLRSDPHSPGRYRVNGVVSNSAHFAEAFQCPENSKMNPSKKCLLW